MKLYQILDACEYISAEVKKKIDEEIERVADSFNKDKDSCDHVIVTNLFFDKNGNTPIIVVTVAFTIYSLDGPRQHHTTLKNIFFDFDGNMIE